MEWAEHDRGSSTCQNGTLPQLQFPHCDISDVFENHGEI